MCGECAAVCVCEQIARKRSGDKGFKNVPAPARQTPPINPENYTFRFPQRIRSGYSNPKQLSEGGSVLFWHFLDSIRSGLTLRQTTVTFYLLRSRAFCYGTRIKEVIPSRIELTNPLKSSGTARLTAQKV